LEPLANRTRTQTRSLPIRILVSLLAVSLVTFAALGGSCSHKPSPPDRAESTLTVGFGFGGSALSQALNSFVDSLYAEPLIFMGWNGRPQPRLALSWAWDESGRTLRLQLRRDVIFHDGTPLSAPVVVGELQKRLAAGSFQRVKRIAADGDDRIILELSEPDAFLLGELSTTTVKIGQEQSIGTGPFVLRSRKPEVALEAFSKYHLGRPAIAHVTVRTYETQRAAWAAAMRGDVEFLHEVNRDAIGFVEAGSRIRTFSFPRPYYIPIVFNLNHPILRRREVRQAINEALDRSAIVKIALHGRGQPADGPIWPDHWAYNAAARTYSYNPETARLRLETARVPIQPAPHGGMSRRFGFRCLFWAEDAQFERIALVVQKQLFEIGVDVEMVPVPLVDLQKRLSEGNFDAILIQMTSGRSLEWTYWFWRSVPPPAQAIARSGYTAADAVLDRMRQARSDEETRMAVADLQRILYEDPPAAFLVRLESARAVANSFVVPSDEPRRDILGTLWQWRPRALAANQSDR
jgi:peptide/nickel transport system substrate-binding protein